MANQALIQGAYQSANKFVDAAGAFNKSMNEQLAIAGKAKKEADQKRSDLMAAMPEIPELDANGNTIEMDEGARALYDQEITSLMGDIMSGDPFDPRKQAKLAGAQRNVDKITGLINTQKAFYKDVQENANSISDVNSPETLDKLEKMKNLKPVKNADGTYGFEDVDGTKYSQKDVDGWYKNVRQIPFEIYNGNAKLLNSTLDGQKPWGVVSPVLEENYRAATMDPELGDDFIYDSLGGTKNQWGKGSEAGFMRLNIDKYNGKSSDEIFAIKRAEMPEGVTDEDVKEALRKDVIQGYMDEAKKLYWQKQDAADRNAGKPDKDTVLNKDIAQRLFNYDAQSKELQLDKKRFGSVDWSKDTVKSLGTDLFASYIMESSGINVNPLLAKDENGDPVPGKVIGYTLDNPNLPKSFAQNIYLDEPLRNIDNRIKMAIGAGRTGAKDAYNELTATAGMRTNTDVNPIFHVQYADRAVNNGQQLDASIPGGMPETSKTAEEKYQEALDTYQALPWYKRAYTSEPKRGDFKD